MEKIASFKVDHLRLKPGVFVSRKDRIGDAVITTFDLRFREPNREPVMDQPAIHTIEHLAATFLRSYKPLNENQDWALRTIYFGPMGCRTGFYLILAGDYKPADIITLLLEMLAWIEKFEGNIPGASPIECGNWREQNIDMAKWECRRYAAIMQNPLGENLEYPSDIT